VLAVAMLLAGCTTTRDVSQMTPAERRMHEQGQDFNRTMAEGAVAGAVLGAILGAALSSHNRAQGAAIGAGVGLAAGTLGGYYVAKQKEAFATEEGRLDSMIGDVRGDNQRLQQLTASAREVIVQDRQRLDQIDREVAAGTAQSDSVRRRLAAVDENAKFLRSTLDNLNKRLAEYRDAATRERRQNHANTAGLDGEIARMEQQVASLESELQALVSRRKVTRVG
jgi:hypothetical protein